jgi:hypothetical protein
MPATVFQKKFNEPSIQPPGFEPYKPSAFSIAPDPYRQHWRVALSRGAFNGTKRTDLSREILSIRE